MEAGFYSRSLDEVLQAYFASCDQRLPLDQLRRELAVTGERVSALHFRHLTIEKASLMKAFSKAMPVLSHFTSLEISDCYIAEDCWYYLAKGLRSLTAIESISVLDDDFSPNKADCLCMAVESMPKLIYLELSGRELSLPTCRVLCAQLPKLSALRTLNVNVTDLGYGQVDLCRALRFMPQLRNLFLFKVELRKKKGLKKLSKSLASSALEKLDLSANDLSKRWGLLVPALTQLPQLWFLRLSSCQLYDAHLVQLSRSLPALQALRELDLSYNELRFLSVDLKSSGIALLPSLTTLNLEWNLASEGTLASLLLQLPMLPKLEALGLNCRFFTEQSYSVLLAVLPSLLRLKSVFSILESDGNALVYRLDTIFDCYYTRP